MLLNKTSAILSVDEKKNLILKSMDSIVYVGEHDNIFTTIFSQRNPKWKWKCKKEAR